MTDIEEIVHWFDFKRVKKTMKLLNWTWVFNGNESRVPTKKELKERAFDLLYDTNEQLKKLDHYTTATGGLCVHGYKVDNKHYFNLSFVLTEWNNYD